MFIKRILRQEGGQTCLCLPEKQVREDTTESCTAIALLEDEIKKIYYYQRGKFLLEDIQCFIESGEWVVDGESSEAPNVHEMADIFAFYEKHDGDTSYGAWSDCLHEAFRRMRKKRLEAQDVYYTKKEDEALTVFECEQLLHACVFFDILQADPYKGDYILIFRSKGEMFSEGFWSEPLRKVARELSGNVEGQRVLFERLKEKGALFVFKKTPFSEALSGGQ